MDGVLAIGGCDKNMPGAMDCDRSYEHPRILSTAAPSNPVITGVI